LFNAQLTTLHTATQFNYTGAETYLINTV